jgi:hypothetical protein
VVLVVTLRAIPSDTGIFAGWSWATSGTLNPINITTDDNKNTHGEILGKSVIGTICTI